jgi:probable phosphoglycerate mutase
VTELLFIRHGETDWNLQQRFQGQTDVALNATGREQARRLAARLAPGRPDALYSSDLSRARETAAPLAAAWDLPILEHAGWREQHFGLFEGLDLAQAAATHPGLWQRWLLHRADDALPGGESTRQFHARVTTALATLAAGHPGERVAVVCHGGVLDMLWRSVHALPLDGARDCAIPNTGLNRLRWTDAGLVIERWADADHLLGLPPQPGTVQARA